MLTHTFAFLEPLVAATRPSRLVLLRRFLLALERSLRNEAERDSACHVAGTVFGLPPAVMESAVALGAEAIDPSLARALADRLEAAPEGLESRADWLVRWGPLVEALVPEGPHGASPVPDMVTLAPDLAALFARLQELSRSSLSLMIEGQPGTGRESLARAIHGAHRAPRPFITVDARTLPPDAGGLIFGSPLAPGLVFQAGGGTLFIRNAEALPAVIQSRLARCLEHDAVVDHSGRARWVLRARLIFAVGEGALASPSLQGLDPDLAWRASTLFTRLPPLAERGEDLAALYRNVVRRFVLRRDTPLSAEEVAREPRMTLTPRALLALYAYGWPGNVTEFVAVVREARQRAGLGPVELSHLPERVVAALGRAGDGPDDRLRAVLLELAPAAVEGAGGQALARRRLRDWRDEQLDRVLGREARDLLVKAIAAYNALREGHQEALTPEAAEAQVRAAAAREILLPTATGVPLFSDERVEFVAELEALAEAQSMAGAISRRLFDMGRALVLFPKQALAQLRPTVTGQEQRPCAVVQALLAAASARSISAGASPRDGGA